jgi:O-methyltransferase
MSDAPWQKYKLLRKIIPSSLQPFLRGVRKRLARPPALQEPYRSVFPFTQAHRLRQEHLVLLAETIDRDGVAGSIVECGVLDGGTAALMAYGTKKSGRPIHLFDSWEGLPNVTEEDGDAGMWSGQVVGSPRRVVAIMNKLGVATARLHFHKGWFAETFPKASIEKIALLHVDGDFYESVKLSLETWFPKISPGGFIQIDDYETFIGCTKAVDDFISTRPGLKLESASGHFAKVYFIKC